MCESDVFEIDPRILRFSQGEREISNSRVKRIKKQIKLHGFDIDKPIEVADLNGMYVIIDGHHRTKAAIQLELSQVPCIIDNTLTSEQKQEYKVWAIEAEEEIF